MAQHQDTGSLLYSLTKPKGVMLAAPLILGAALVFTSVSGGDTNARDGAKAAETGTKAAAATTQLARAASTGGPSEAGKAEGGSLANAAINKTVEQQPETAKTPDAGAGSGTAAPIRLAAADKPAAKSAFTAAQRAEFGQLVRDYLMKNPEVLVDISAELEKRRKAEQENRQSQVLVEQKKTIFRSKHDFVLGNPDGDVTVVEYFDYNCGWCKRALDEVNKLTDADKNVRVVMKEFPIFGEDSTFAAKAALASMEQGKYWDVHVAMMRAERVTKANALDIAKSVGVDIAKLKKEMEDPKYDRIIAENSRVAQELGMQGTPGFIVDSRVNFGFVPSDGLKTMLADIRKQGCKIC